MRSGGITDDDLREALFRADRLLAGSHNCTLGDLYISSDAVAVDIFVSGGSAMTYYKNEYAMESLANIRERSRWSPSLLDRALQLMRAATVLDDLAEIRNED